MKCEIIVDKLLIVVFHWSWNIWWVVEQLFQIYCDFWQLIDIFYWCSWGNRWERLHLWSKLHFVVFWGFARESITFSRNSQLKVNEPINEYTWNFIGRRVICQLMNNLNSIFCSAWWVHSRNIIVTANWCKLYICSNVLSDKFQQVPVSKSWFLQWIGIFIRRKSILNIHAMISSDFWALNFTKMIFSHEWQFPADCKHTAYW